jgi:subtilase family serine protease
VAALVLGIRGLDDFDQPVPHIVQTDAMRRATGSGPHGQFVGPDMRQAYYGHGNLTGAGQSVGVFELGAYNPQDIQTYFTRIGAPFNVPITNVAVNGIDVTCTTTCHDAEQALDIEEVISMAPGLNQLVYYGGRQPISILARMASDDICATLSVSWGWKPRPKLDEPVLQEMAAQGQSLLVASGDDGFRLKRGVVWPADDAWAIAVGGTDVRTQGAGGPWAAERGWRFSGGGPSPDGIALPVWQAGSVNSANGASPTLRNVPDIAADADTDNYSCYDGRCRGGNGGTSYAAPLWAGFVALANQQAAASGLPSIGFFTPALYARAIDLETLHDETLGFNGKYYAQPGFDLVTGLGSPFGAMTIGGLLVP